MVWSPVSMPTSLLCVLDSCLCWVRSLFVCVARVCVCVPSKWQSGRDPLTSHAPCRGRKKDSEKKTKRPMMPSRILHFDGEKYSAHSCRATHTHSELCVNPLHVCERWPDVRRQARAIRCNNIHLWYAATRSSSTDGVFMQFLKSTNGFGSNKRQRQIIQTSLAQILESIDDSLVPLLLL